MAERSQPLRLRFSSADRFDEGDVVWLRPDPDPRLLRLVDDVLTTFPEHPPYDGRYPEPTPHLTVSADGGADLLAEVREALDESGPVEHDVDRISVFARDADDVWREAAWVPLGGGSPVSVA